MAYMSFHTTETVFWIYNGLISDVFVLTLIIVRFEGLTRASHQDGLSLDLDEVIFVYYYMRCECCCYCASRVPGKSG